MLTSSDAGSADEHTTCPDHSWCETSLSDFLLKVAAARTLRSSPASTPPNAIAPPRHLPRAASFGLWGKVWKEKGSLWAQQLWDHLCFHFVSGFRLQLQRRPHPPWLVCQSRFLLWVGLLVGRRWRVFCGFCRRQRSEGESWCAGTLWFVRLFCASSPLLRDSLRRNCFCDVCYSFLN